MSRGSLPGAHRVRSEDIGTDAELGSARISVLKAMGISPDQATVKQPYQNVATSTSRVLDLNAWMPFITMRSERMLDNVVLGLKH